jgi:hypothetical protein
MIPPLDVFAVRDSESQWLDSAQTLAEALELIRRTGPGSYLVFSQKTEHKSFYKVSLNGSISLDVAK